MQSPIVAPEVLASWVRDARPDLRIVDVRWYLGQPAGAGRAAYEAGHLPGAVHLDVDGDLTAGSGPGRHPLPDPRVFASSMSAAGIGDDDLVVAYDDVGGWVAARLWWMLEDLGFGTHGRGKAVVLDGGLPAWTAAGLPTTSRVPMPATGSLHLATAWRRVIDRTDLRKRLGSVLLIDVRGAPRYRGEVEPIDPLPGHIPTAVNAPTDGNLGPDGRFASPADLAERIEGLRDAAAVEGFVRAPDRDADVVVSCGSGVSACHEALAMRIAGLPDPILYPGSYSDWVTAGEPVVTGPAPGRPPT